MVWKGCERSVITYSSLISACEKAGQWELALELFNEMHSEGCIPNTVTFNSLITACAQGEVAVLCSSWLMRHVPLHLAAQLDLLAWFAVLAVNMDSAKSVACLAYVVQSLCQLACPLFRCTSTFRIFAPRWWSDRRSLRLTPAAD